MIERYDSIVIGTGQSGPSLAVRLAQAGRKTAIVERKLFGGTCVNTGCIPTKTLIASARVAHLARRAADFGVVVDGVRVDMARVKARKDAVVRASSQGVENWLKGTPNLTVYEGHARFEGPRTVRVGDAQLEAGEIFIDVGTRAPRARVSGPARGRAPDERRHAGARRAARAPGGGRRQLHRPGVRPDVPALRRPRHRGRDGPAADRARGRGGVGGDPRDPRRRGHRGPAQRQVHHARTARARHRRRRSTARTIRTRSTARTCCSRSGACRTPTIWAWTRPA